MGIRCWFYVDDLDILDVDSFDYGNFDCRILDFDNYDYVYHTDLIDYNFLLKFIFRIKEIKKCFILNKITPWIMKIMILIVLIIIWIR